MRLRNFRRPQRRMESVGGRHIRPKIKKDGASESVDGRKGFCTYFDEVGNLFGRIAGKKEEVIFDRLPQRCRKNGGKYDGALGVITAIEGISALYQNMDGRRKP